MRRDKSKFELYSKMILPEIREKSTIKSTKPKHHESRLNLMLSAPELLTSTHFMDNSSQAYQITPINLPKINFTLGSPRLSKFRTINLFSSKPDFKEAIAKSPLSLTKLSSIYESITQLENSISTPKNYLDSSKEIQCELTGKSRDFFRQMRLCQELEVMKMLKSDRSLADIRDSSGKTPLHWAAMRNCIPIAKLLINYGADVNARDYCNRTAKDHALRSNFSAMYKLLDS